MKKIILSSFLVLVILTSSIYFLMPDKVRIDIENTRTKYSVYEDGFTLAATEYVNLFDGTKKMRASSREVTYWNDSEFAYAERRSEWKDNITTIQTYTFGIYEENVEEFPLENEFQCLNCEGKIVHFEIRDILYNGETKVIDSPFSFGHNMEIEWGDGAYYSKVFQQKVASDKIIIKYRPLTDNETYSVRLFDPVYDSLVVTGAVSLGGNLTYSFVDFQPGSVITINATGYLNITAIYNITVSGTINGNGLISTANGGTGGTGSMTGGGGGGASHNSTGGNGGAGEDAGGGGAGVTYDFYNNRTLLFTGRAGGAGGRGGAGGGGKGGSALILTAPEIKINGTINLKGVGGGSATADSGAGGGGGGSGGKIIIEGVNIEVNDSTMVVTGANGGTGAYNPWWNGAQWIHKDGGGGGGGAGGIIAIFYEDDFFNASLITTLTQGSGGAPSGPDAGGGGAGTIGTYTYEQVDDLNLNIPPEVDLNSPANNTISTPSVQLNGTVTDEQTLTNNSLILDGEINETNSSGIQGIQLFDKILADGEHNWTCRAFDDDDDSTTADVRFINIDGTIPIPNIDYPINDSYIINVSDLNYTVIETNPSYCWYSNDSGVTNSSVQTCMDNWTDVISIEGQNTWIVYANDTVNNENSTNISFFKDTITPLIDFESETENNGTSYNKSFIYANVSVIETNEQNITYYLYWQNGTLTNSSTYTTARREINWTGLEYGIYLYDVTVFDILSQSNSTKTRTIYLSNIFLFIDGKESDLHIELNTTVNITGNSTFDFGLVCLDIDHPDYGDNYTCSDKSVTTNLTFDYFRKTTFWNGTTTWNFSDFNLTGGTYFTNETLNFTSHQYDEIDDLSINISSLDNAKDIIFYGCNTSSFDRYYKGFLVGTNIYLNQSVDSSGAVFYNYSNVTFDNPGNATVYFAIDDNATIINISMNVTGKDYGFSYFDEFLNWSNIDISETTAQLHYGPAGFIQAPNSSLSLRTFDDFSGNINIPPWVNSTSTSGTGFEYGVRQTGGYLESYVDYDASLGSGPTGEQTKSFYPSSNYLDFFTSDFISFETYGEYTGNEGSDLTGCRGYNYINFGGTTIWTSMIPKSEDSGGAETDVSDIDFELTKINHTHWRVNMSGTETSYAQNADDCDGHGERTEIKNWANGTYILYYGDPDCSGDNIYTTLSNSTVREIVSYPVLFFSTFGRYDGPDDCLGSETFLRLDNVKNKMWDRGNGTVISNSIFDSSTNIISSTMNYSSADDGDYTFSAYMSADNGDHWESITNGVEKTFSYPGKHMKYRIFFNTTNPGYQNITAYIANITITTPVSNVSNLEFDFGNDGTWDYKLNGTFGSANDTLVISMPNADISNAFSSKRTLFSHMYQIPMRISSASAGQLNIDTFNITYNPNPVILNSTAVQDYLNDYGSNETNVSITIAGASGTVNVSDIRFDYAGGNSTIKIIVRNILNTMSVTKYIYPYYSRWDYMFVPLHVDFLEFIPRTPTSLNVTPYGQTNSTAILNLTNYGYGDKNANLSVYLNDTISCVNLTMSTTWDKEAGHQLNSSWIELDSNRNYLETNEIFMWADYNCSYNNWTLFNPYIYFRQCCDGCTCSEEVT